MIDGRTVMELPNVERSTREVMDMWTYLSHRLERAVPAPAAVLDDEDRMPASAPVPIRDAVHPALALLG